MAERTLNFKTAITADSKLMSEKALREVAEKAVADALNKSKVKAEVKVVRLRSHPVKG